MTAGFGLPLGEAAAQLWQAAVQAAGMQGFDIDPGCAQHLQAFIADGLARVGDSGILELSRLQSMRGDLERFVEQMVVEAREMGYKELHEPTFFAAKAKLCPLWPFC